MSTRRVFEIRLSGSDSTVPVAQRLRSALKLLLRVFGLKCTHIKEVPEKGSESTAASEKAYASEL